MKLWDENLGGRTMARIDLRLEVRRPDFHQHPCTGVTCREGRDRFPNGADVPYTCDVTAASRGSAVSEA